MFKSDTIAAISTPQGTGGVGIIRISGADAFKIAEGIFKGKRNFSLIKSHTINYGKIIDPKNGDIVDEVLLTKMERPNTFTREDVIEINCHGGIVVLRKVLQLVLSKGARLADPGEFTQRAFMNGRIDLSQAEAVIDLINSKTEESSRAAINQLEGILSAKLKEARNKLIELIAHMEVTFDYPEHDIEEITAKQSYEEAKIVKELLEKLLSSFEKGRILREGLSLVIVGRPNVGKSSLLNRLSGRNKAIVTDIPGTTRDIIEEYINIKGIPIRLLDTAGIRETEDLVEKLGVAKAQEEIDAADFVIFMIDATDVSKKDNVEIYNRIKHRKHVIVVNKIDLVEKDEDINTIPELQNKHKIKISLKEGTGLDELENEITELFYMGEIRQNEEALVTNVRHKNLIALALESVNEALGAYENGMPLDLISIDINNAAQYLGQITGESVSEDMMREIFSRFCIGK